MAKGWWWDFDGGENLHNGPHDELEEAIEEACSYYDDDPEYNRHITVGYCAGNFKPHIYAELLLDTATDQAYDDCAAEDFLVNVDKEKKQELEKEINRVFQNWLKKHKLEANFGALEPCFDVDLEVKEKINELCNKYKNKLPE